MKNLFLDYEHSKMLKELGFNLQCFCYYRDGNIYNAQNYNSEVIEGECSAPTQDQAEEWLWEKHKIHIGVWREGTYYYYRIEYAVTKTRIVFAIEPLENPIDAKRKGICYAIKYLHEQFKAGRK